ncbi:MAG TPA: LON peptidase substrate-binding domain-containing protein [Parafilimonas sp.]|nr:LON peptidase substrate-binding domain-containing protein [Parafilimonas sp.]
MEVHNTGIFTFARIMTNFIPIFPLELVVYPGEKVNLHIFEERYKQLIAECNKDKKLFGIPAVIKNKISETGTLVAIEDIVKQYDDGRLDITTKGVSVFRILEVIDSIPAKLYSGAIVKHLSADENGTSKHVQKVIDAIRELHVLLHVKKDFNKPDAELKSFDIAHHAGLSLEEEYELLNLLREDQRVEYLRRHLKKIIPLVAGVENLKKRIQLNGHFRELKGFDPGIGKK